MYLLCWVWNSFLVSLYFEKDFYSIINIFSILSINYIYKNMYVKTFATMTNFLSIFLSWLPVTRCTYFNCLWCSITRFGNKVLRFAFKCLFSQTLINQKFSLIFVEVLYTLYLFTDTRGMCNIDAFLKKEKAVKNERKTKVVTKRWQHILYVIFGTFCIIDW